MNLILLPPSAVVNDTAIIDDKRQLNHLMHVLKVQIGDKLKIGVLGGKMGQGVVSVITPKQIVLTCLLLNISPPPKMDMAVVLALPRPKVLRRLVMDMTAMGVAHMVLVNSYRTDKSYWQSPLLSCLDDFIQEGLEQAKDTIAPTLTLAKRFKPFIQDDLPKFHRPIMLAHPYGSLSIQEYHDTPKTLIIGAEGGFIDYELALMQDNGAVAVSLGQRILRTESAVSAVLGRFI